MENALKVKANMERFFFEKAVDYGKSPSKEVERLQHIDFNKLAIAIKNQRRPLRGYTGFVAHKWRHDCSYQGDYYPKATLLIRVLNSTEEAKLSPRKYPLRYKDPCTRHYMELWVDHNMQLKVVSCIQHETPDDYFEADYITQYRKVEGTHWPDDHGEINLEELIEILNSKARKTSVYNQTELYVPLRGEEALLYELSKVKNADLQS